jgi:CRISPR system Cascade subunit CasA
MLANVASFPLTDRPWIQVLDRDSRLRLVSLRQLFAECGQLRGLAGDLPTQTFAILRLLLAILHRGIGGPPDEKAWRLLWRDSALPIRDIEDYVAAYRERFDLLHPTTPFYQVADLHIGNGEVTGLERIVADVPNGFAYLTSRVGSGLAQITPADAARWVVHCQAYDTSGIKSGAVGDPRVKGGKGYPIGPGVCGSLGGVFLEGQTLRETLLLNLIPLDSDYLHQDPERDLPVWERPAHAAAEESETARGPYGVLGLYTWQSRRIRLFGDEQAITGSLVANGDKLAWDNRHHLEPMSPWRRSKNKEKDLKLPQVYVPGLHDHTRSLWRGLHALLPAAGAATGQDGPTRLVPALTQWLARVRNAGYVEPGFRVTTRALGVVYGTQQSVIEEIYHDALTMNVQAFDPASGLPTLIIDSAADAEAAVKALRTLAANLCRAAGGSGSNPAAAETRASQHAFATLDQQFRGWLAMLGPDTNRADVRALWQQTVRRAVVGIGDELVAQAGPAAWAGRSLDNDQYISSPQADLFFRRALLRALPLAAASSDPTHKNAHDAQEVPV